MNSERPMETLSELGNIDKMTSIFAKSQKNFRKPIFCHQNEQQKPKKMTNHEFKKNEAEIRNLVPLKKASQSQVSIMSKSKHFRFKSKIIFVPAPPETIFNQY